MHRRWLVTLALAVGCSSLIASPASSADRQSRLSLHVHKEKREMRLQRGDRLVRRFRVVLGFNPTAHKRRLGDGRTPEGRYLISEKNPSSKYHRFLGINYPSYDDAEWGLQQQLISGTQWADIFFAHMRRVTPPSSTPLGGRVGIHGFGHRPVVPLDWTQGCIAISNEEIDYLYDTLPLGTPVVIGQ
jgi:hypothetical protein